MKYSFIFVFLLVITLSSCEQPPAQRHREAANTQQNASAAQVKSDVEKKAAKTIKAASQADLTPVPSFKPFYVYESKGSRENHFIPSGFMPNGNCLKFSDLWQKDCQLGTTCIRVEYDVECSRKDEKWAGIYWLNPANNWGSRKGGFNLTGAKRLTFWARGEKGGEQIQEFTVGGITGDYPDSDTSVIGPVILGTQWREYSIDLRGKDLSYISGGFAWTTSEDVNPQDCTFYLDNIKFE